MDANAPEAPSLHFDLETPFDDLISLRTLDSMPLSQALDPLSGQPSPNNPGNGFSHAFTPNDTHNVPSAAQLASAFEQKMTLAIDNRCKTTKPDFQEPHSSTMTHVKKKLVAQSNFSPPQPSPPLSTVDSSIRMEELIYDENDDNDEDEVPQFGMAAPQLDLTTVKDHPEQPSQFYPTNGSHQQQQQQQQQQYGAPTPREWKFQWDTSPRMPQSRTPATNPPRITDPMLIQSALQGVAYYADKLDQLHSEYRRVYSEQQQLNHTLQSLDSTSMDPSEYKRRFQSMQSQYMYMSQTLQSLIGGIYEQFQKMDGALRHKYDLQLDRNMHAQFARFQRYHDQFASAQTQLLMFARQQQQQKQQKQQQQQQQQQMIQQQQQQQQQQNSQSYSYQVPPTPSNYRQRIQNAYKATQDDQKMQYYQAQMQQHMNSMTPRGNAGNQNYNQQQYSSHRNYPQTTSAIPDRKFSWSKEAYYAQNNVAQASQSRTPRNMNQQASQQPPKTGKPKAGDIPQMAYVLIGSRMSQVLSHIALPEQEVRGHQQRIKQSLSDVLGANHRTFVDYDIVPYGSAQQKLFIKEYSDFDFCIRCAKCAVPHDEAMRLLMQSLTEQAVFSELKVVTSKEESVHGANVVNVAHITCKDTVSGRKVDIVLNNLPEIGSSRFITAYESIDPRFALLCRVVKYWARQRKINDPIRGTLSTYALVLMVINYLQSRRVMPTLSIMVDTETGLGPWSTQDDYAINVQKYRDFASKNEEPHSRLLVNFFYFYAYKFSFADDVVSVRTGTYLMKAQNKWNNSKHWICVENPFNSKTNLTQNVNEENMHRVWNEFKRAYTILCKEYKIYDMCKLAEK